MNVTKSDLKKLFIRLQVVSKEVILTEDPAALLSLKSSMNAVTTELQQALSDYARQQDQNRIKYMKLADGCAEGAVKDSFIQLSKEALKEWATATQAKVQLGSL